IWHLYHLGIKDTHSSDFVGLTEGTRQTLDDRLRMVYTGYEGHELFTSYVWRRLFEIRAPLVREFILKFLGTCRMSNTEMDLDVAETLCFKLSEVRHRMTWRQFILALGFHTYEEMAETGFGPYWLGSDKVILDKGDLRDYWIEISSDRDFLGMAPSYVFIQDTVTLCLAAHFRLVSDQGLRGLSVVTSELSLINLHKLKRLNIYVRVDDIWAWVALRPERHNGALWGCEEMLMDRSLIRAFYNTRVGSLWFPYQRHTTRRTDDANTSAPQQPDP
nr:hypothetical protein [Tanacetum cinerariifolium]GFA48533.1 hypothetical protein [Tanacetum cinerariifolium]